MTQMPKRTQLLGLIGWLGITFAAAGAGSLASLRAGAFYTQLARPPWAPPPSIFGPVWTVLYVLMGLAAWLVWRINGFQGGRAPLGLFVIQLALNAVWTWLFFTWRLGLPALVDILLLWVLVLATLMAFWRVTRMAAVLLLPYLLWVGFAAALTCAIWRLNPQLLG